VNQSFARQLRRGVKGSLNRERVIFRRGNNLGLAINAARGRERNDLGAIGAHRFEHVERGDGVLIQVLARMLQAEADVGIRGEMKNGCRNLSSRRSARQGRGCAANQFEIRFFSAASTNRSWPVEKIVPAHDLLALPEQIVRERAANKTGGAGHKNSFQMDSLLRVCGASRAGCIQTGAREALNSKT